MNASTGHNLHSVDHAPQRGSEALLMALRSGRPEHTPESEPVVIALNGPEILLLLDDGEALRFDAAELVCSDPIRTATANRTFPRSTRWSA